MRINNKGPRILPAGMPDKVMTIKEIAPLLVVAAATVYGMVQAGEAAAFKMRQQRCITRSERNQCVAVPPRGRDGGRDGNA